MTVHDVQHHLSPLLSPLGRAYGLLMAHRRRLYETGRLRFFSPAVPTVSVGNIGWGGTGKTPVTDWLLDWAEAQALRAVVLTRGYKAHPPVRPYLVDAASTAEQAGDEPLMLARSHPASRVVVDSVRSRSGAWAQEALHPDLFIMDDGFQHQAVRRHCDLVLLRPEDLTTEWNRVIPSGSWRENADALTRADAILIKASPEAFAGLVPHLESRLGHLGVPVFGFSLEPTHLYEVGGSATPASASARPAELLCGDYVLFSGVGQPAQVETTMENFIGTAPTRHYRFPDHHRFTAEDIRRMADQGLPMVCTPKDAVKLSDIPMPDSARILTCALKTRFGSTWNVAESFPLWWETTWQTLASA